jgi:tellurite methyltransferase
MARSIAEWNERYRQLDQIEAFEATPSAVVIETCQHLKPGRALDLACGTGRNALWLAKQGWTISAVDASEVAINTLRSKAKHYELMVESIAADLTSPEFTIKEARWDLVLMCYYLQRSLFPSVKKAVVAGGTIVVLAHLADPGEPPTETRLLAGELVKHFDGWIISHSYEGKARDLGHQRPVAEIVAQRPVEY